MSDAGSLSGRTVLVVEDEVLISLDLSLQLEDAGAAALIAESVAQGAQLLEERSDRIDAAILDMRLPDGDSTPLAEDLTRRRIPFLFHSGHTRPEDVAERFPDAPALSKPTPWTELEQHLDHLIRQQAI
ncbi:response regulator [Jannaschia aquimarina]|uniref:Hybrid sensory histidine kinase TorS n=1 Tax=Jannaschia aquimarina TaxID=935700 RepID=A0A0D1DAE9_9RHOB|nr:response regulator [Jannaschia aquimarina]KIT16893.1 hybrid sensory histidine kinase TorS [Jannaschia aquimarina]SNT12173.1 Response regulator receiver domain-containing protein [Jannaschia aquimarina]